MYTLLIQLVTFLVFASGVFLGSTMDWSQVDKQVTEQSESKTHITKTFNDIIIYGVQTGTTVNRLNVGSNDVTNLDIVSKLTTGYTTTMTDEELISLIKSSKEVKIFLSNYDQAKLDEVDSRFNEILEQIKTTGVDSNELPTSETEVVDLAESINQ